jgi:hypothetical protein
MMQRPIGRICLGVLVGAMCFGTILALFFFTPPVKVPESNLFINEFISNNWQLLLIWWIVFKALFPNSRFLEQIGDSMSAVFPVFKRPNGRRETDPPAKE